MRKLSSILIMIVSIQVIFASLYNGFDVKYDRISSDKMQLKFTVGSYNIETTEKNGQNYTVINFDGKVVTNDKGFAELPYISRAINIEDIRNISIKVNQSEYEEITLDHPLLPSRGVLSRSQDISIIPYEIDKRSIKDEWYPGEVSYNSDPFIIRNVRGSSIVVQPFQYNSATNTLRVYKNVTVDIVYNDDKPINPLKRMSSQVEPEMSSIYSSLFINYNETKTLEIGDEGEILIIHTDQNGGLPALEPYIQWKREKGFIVNTMEVTNGTDLSAAQTVKDAYDANSSILYVQLVGDWANLKSKFEDYPITSSDGSEDPVLGHVVGRDNYQDVIIGRFSVQSESQLLTQINKAINYEKNPEIGGEWYKKGLVLASNEGAGMGDDGESDEQHNEIIKDNKLLASTYDDVNTCYQSAGDNVSNISGYANAGLSTMTYTGHGYYQSWSNPGINNSGVSNLRNGSKLPFVISVACLVGHLSYGADCFAEAWLKNENGGAVVGWFSTISQPWLPPMRGQDYFYDLLIGGYDYTSNPGSGTITTEQRTTFGGLTVNAAHLTLAEAPLDDSTLATIETWTIFGDASLQLRTDTPKPIINTNSILLTENYSTRILVVDEPVEGARVTLYQNGLNFTGLTNSEGNVSIDHTFTEGNVTITVSGFNLETIQNIVPVVILDGPYIKVNNYSISSNCFGETAYGQFELKNIGIQNSNYVNLNVTTESSYVTFSDEVENYGNISIGDSVVISDCISFQIDSNTPDQERIEFITQITDNFTKRSYNSKFYMTINSPIIDINHDLGADYLNPGDSKDISFRIENSGKADLSNFTVELNQITDYPVNLQSPSVVEVLNSESYTDLIFNCSFDPSVPLSSSVELVLILDNGNGFQTEYEFAIPVGLTETFESGDFSNNDWIMSGTDWVTDDTEVYNGNYSSKSGLISHSQKSKMSVEYNFGESGSISFYRKVSSEINYDYLYFYIDSNEKAKWSGDKGWEQISYAVPPGIHELSWSYEKDPTTTKLEDCAWVDNILASGLVTGIESSFENSPKTTILYKNYPNPFNPSTEIKFYISSNNDVKLSVFNSNGQLVRELLNDKLNKGMHLLKFNAENLNSGVYYYILETENSKLSEKMLLIK
ncbi:MAG: C25 family cysteine peptidase [Candidatus Delongbacteria bacterium]|jgi:hypothetical protein|nr:C25 family cysteine peptidase [Candidatus Delongbacteria bacterium]